MAGARKSVVAGYWTAVKAVVAQVAHTLALAAVTPCWSLRPQKVHLLTASGPVVARSAQVRQTNGVGRPSRRASGRPEASHCASASHSQQCAAIVDDGSQCAGLQV